MREMIDLSASHTRSHFVVSKRIRDNLCNTLTRKFIDEMKAYQSAQQKYKTDIKTKVKRQVQIVKPDATDEDIDNVLRSEGGRDALYKESILAGGVNDQVKTTYAKVAGKYQDVLTLEQSVAELHQMFLDFAVRCQSSSAGAFCELGMAHTISSPCHFLYLYYQLLTEQQGELLDQIEFQVKQAGDYVEDANVDLYQGIEYQSKVRKKQCWLILIVVVLMVVLLLSIGII
jgi:t-SNARE complex subunit (syntaxin)